MIGSEVEFFLFKESYDDANALRLPRPHAELAVPRGLQHPPDDQGGGRARRDAALACAAPGMPVEFSKGEAGRGQHEINLTYQRGVEMADIDVIFKTAVKEIAALARQVGDVHGQAALRRRRARAATSTPACGTPTDASRAWMAGDVEHHMSDLFRWYLGGQMATAAEFALLFAPTVNSYKRFLPGSVGADRASGGTSTTARSGSASSATATGMRVESRIPGADANPYHAFAATIAGGLYGIANRIEPPAPYHGNGYAATDLTRIPSTFAEAIELWRASTIARECFGDDVHHHVLHFAETEWPRSAPRSPTGSAAATSNASENRSLSGVKQCAHTSEDHGVSGAGDLHKHAHLGGTGVRQRWSRDDRSGPRADLNQLGYAEELRRKMGWFSNFAISFSIISILAGGLTSFWLGMVAGGPIVITLGWIIVGFFALLVGMSMGEICSAYPTAGGLYYWSAKLARKNPAKWSWFTGYFNLLGQIGVIAPSTTRSRSSSVTSSGCSTTGST